MTRGATSGKNATQRGIAPAAEPFSAWAEIVGMSGQKARFAAFGVEETSPGEKWGLLNPVRAK
jgi:hypothetical protein